LITATGVKVRVPKLAESKDWVNTFESPVAKVPEVRVGTPEEVVVPSALFELVTAVIVIGR
jgi:hypothetical protein